MKITAIKAQVKNPDRVSIFVDGTYSFSLTLDQLLDEKLKKDLELGKADIDRLKKVSDEGKLKARTMEWMMGRPHATREFRDYLYRKKADEDLIDAWVDEFTAKGYLDDERFARWFAENRRRKHKSDRAIVSEVMTKGIPLQTAQKVVAELAREEDSEQGSEGAALRALLQKLRGRPRYQDSQKLIAYLLSKGFRYSDVKKELDNS